MKNILTLLLIVLMPIIVAGQTAEVKTKVVINQNLSLDLTPTEYNMLKRHFNHKKKSEDWAQYNVYDISNSQVKKNPRVVFMGNSITQGWRNKSKAFFEDNNFVGRGISGQTTYQMLARFQSDVINLNPQIVVILAGTNDIANNSGIITLEHLLENIKSMCEIAKYNNIKPILCSVLPAYVYGWYTELGVIAEDIIKFNKMLEAYAKKSGFEYVDFHSAMVDERSGLHKTFSNDGVHPNKAGYTTMEEVIGPVLDICTPPPSAL